MTRQTLTRERVVRRAAELADAGGMSSATLSAVARSFGVRTPSLYGHVRDLAALRDGITVLALHDLGEQVGEAIAGRSGRDALIGFGDAHRAFARRHPGLWESLQGRASETVVRDPSAARIVRHAEAVLHGYGIAETDRVHMIRLIGGALNGFLNLERRGDFDHSEPPAEQSWPVLLDSLDLMLSRWNERDRDA
ncbi:TetR/AcrR family transcriptional regulator [Agromyces sp. GXS1127]|uniref:TetR/AcrR family transcriptional regulator n=1 Tax=Agromyces sp. GXS1127 TaxID=3424181 RepID=UPI003D311828